MKNSPSICQRYVSHILSPVCKTFPDAIIYHHMEDILICTQSDSCLDMALKRNIKIIEDAGFEIAQDKIQSTCTWIYLGLWIGERTIIPQQLPIKDDPKTL
ncbi:endogenous retrovirus group K member 18 Pol protein-like protein [Turdus rufiventris]|nr:endogenous retrovirus group K member 18 Pol protein-like protein [Turdus rufiventris]